MTHCETRSQSVAAEKRKREELEDEEKIKVEKKEKHNFYICSGLLWSEIYYYDYLCCSIRDGDIKPSEFKKKLVTESFSSSHIMMKYDFMLKKDVRCYPPSCVCNDMKKSKEYLLSLCSERKNDCKETFSFLCDKKGKHIFLAKKNNLRRRLIHFTACQHFFNGSFALPALVVSLQKESYCFKYIGGKQQFYLPIALGIEIKADKMLQKMKKKK